MAVSVTVAGVTYQIPTTNEELWGVNTTDYLVALGEELANVVVVGDVAPDTLVIIGDNQTDQNVTDFVLDGSVIRAATAEYFVHRSLTGPAGELAEAGTMHFIYNDTTATWSFAQVGVDVGSSGVTFSMNGSQLRYTSSNSGSTGHTGTMKFRIRALPKT